MHLLCGSGRRGVSCRGREYGSSFPFTLKDVLQEEYEKKTKTKIKS
jgi:hypothetical protein